MAVTTEQVLAEISEYREANARPCPANHLTAKFGDEVLGVIASLKKAGTIVGKRGRTGGLVPADAAASTVESTDSADGESVADQFAALAAKLAEDAGSDEIAADAANG